MKSVLCLVYTVMKWAIPIITNFTKEHTYILSCKVCFGHKRGRTNDVNSNRKYLACPLEKPFIKAPLALVARGYNLSSWRMNKHKIKYTGGLK